MRIFNRITAERTSSTSPSDAPILQRQLAAYHAARDYVQGKAVLELGCGEGVGTAILAEAASELLAIDYSRKAVETASRNLSSGKIRFQVERVPPIRIADGRFDVVIMFQMIEHLDRAEPLIEEICRVLKDRGTLLVATVNKEESLTDNPFHLHEFNREELEELLGKYFAEVGFFGLFGNEKYDHYLEKNKARVNSIMRLDVFDISSKIPLGVRRILYSVANRVMRMSLRFGNEALCDGITHENFILKKGETTGCLDFFVVCGR